MSTATIPRGKLTKQDARAETLRRIRARLDGNTNSENEVRSRQITLLPWQQQVIAEAKRFNVPNLGRRSGKTRLCAKLAEDTVLLGQPVGWFAPTYKILADAWRELKIHLAPITATKNESTHTIETHSGGILECWSLDRDPDAGRSRKYARVIIDEAAKVPKLEEAWTQAIRPTLTDLRGDAWFPSTPRGINYYKFLYDRGQDPLNADWKSWKLPTLVNTLIDPEEIEDARRDLPETVFKQEYLAEFNDFAGAVFRNINEVCIGSPDPQGDDERHIYVFGVDWGKINDFTVISVWDTCCNREVWLERFNQIDYQFQLGRLAALKDKYSPISIIAEQNSIGIPLIEQLYRAWPNLIEPFNTNQASKRYIVEGLALSMDRRRVTMLDDVVGVAELQAFESKRTMTGYSYSAPSGMHDDTVIARALGHSPLIETVPTSGILVRGSAWSDTESDGDDNDDGDGSASDEYSPVLAF